MKTNIKVPPHNLEAEQAVLSGMLQNNKTIPVVREILDSGDFYRGAHTYLYDGIISLHEDNQVSDIVTLNDFLMQRNLLEKAGGMDYLMSLVDIITTTAGIKHYAEIVKELSLKRSIIKQCSVICELGLNQLETSENLASELKNFLRDLQKDDMSIPHDNTRDYNNLYNDLGKKDIEPGFKTGLPIDNYFYLEPKTTTVLSAESGIGKSALCLQILDFVAYKYGKSLYFTLESTVKALTRRQLARFSRISLSRLKNKNLENYHFENVNRALDKLTNSNSLIIDHAKFQTIENIISFSETISLEHDIKLIIVDHLGHLGTNKQTRSELAEIKHITNQLNFLAKNLDCSVIYVAPLRKDINGRPKLDDIKGFNDIRYNGDNILLAWSPDKTETTQEHEVELFLGKGKDIEGFKQWLHFNGHYQLFTEGTMPPELYKKKNNGIDI